MTDTTPDCPECGVGMQKSNGGDTQCPYCDSWAFRDAVSDGEIYAAVSRKEQTMSTKAATEHVHRRPCKRDFEGKTIHRFKADADNVWRIWFTDGTAFAIQCDTFGPHGVPGMELCDVCAQHRFEGLS